MKKVLCNVLYEVKIPVYHKEMGDISLDVGLFDEKEDAEVAGMITKRILDNSEDYEQMLSVFDYSVAREYLPDSEMRNQQNSTRYYPDLNHFAMNDKFVNDFIDTNGITALETLVCECMEEIERSGQQNNIKSLNQ